MTSISSRYNLLCQPYQDSLFFETMYGININQEIIEIIELWEKEQYRRPHGFESDNSYNRLVFENFCLSNHLVPRKQASLKLGMKLASYDQLIEVLEEKRPSFYNLKVSSYPNYFYRSELLEGFEKIFEPLRNKIFSDYSNYCRQLHEAIKDGLAIPIEPEKCKVSLRLESSEEEADYANEIDCITLEPIGLRYQVWLQTNKPMNLSPDRCGLHTYKANHAFLAGKIIGEEPELPDEI